MRMGLERMRRGEVVISVALAFVVGCCEKLLDGYLVDGVARLVYRKRGRALMCSVQEGNDRRLGWRPRLRGCTFVPSRGAVYLVTAAARFAASMLLRQGCHDSYCYSLPQSSPPRDQTLRGNWP